MRYHEWLPANRTLHWLRALWCWLNEREVADPTELDCEDW